MATALSTVLLMAAAALGGGLLVFRQLRIAQDGCPLVRAASAAVIGIGLIGWLGFPLAFFGLLTKPAFLVPLVTLASGIWFWPRTSWRFETPGLLTSILLVVLAAALAFDISVGLAPPIDADSLAYHFMLPKLFLREGQLVFIPQAADSAVPLLQQMTFMVALGLGGEQAMTLWATVSNLATVGALFAIARRHVGDAWALGLSILFLTTPAMVYGMGSGQMEGRNAGFVLVAAYWVLRGVRGKSMGAVVLAGLAAGFFVGAKYTGLIFAGTLGLAVLVWARALLAPAALGAVIVLAGFQWYAWNWANTGDPLFPMLFGHIAYPDGAPWNTGQDAYFKSVFGWAERALPRTPLSLLLYPLLATLTPDPRFESLRTGFGPLWLVVLPLVLWGGWRARHRILRSDLLFYLVLVLAGYAIWFLAGPSQRVRHFLPLYPLLLIVLAGAVKAAVASRPATAKAVVLAVAPVLILQIGGNGLFAAKALAWLRDGQSREQFFDRFVPGFHAIEWVNRTAGPGSLTLVENRDGLYLYDVPVFLAHNAHQAVIDVRPAFLDAGRIWRQMKAHGVTDLLLVADGSLAKALEPIVTAGCAVRTKTFAVRMELSRTLPSYQTATSQWAAYRLTGPTCAVPEEPSGGDK